MNARNNKAGRSQLEHFKEAARELGCDDSEEAFDDALRKVARHKPKDEKTKPSGPAKREPE